MIIDRFTLKEGKLVPAEDGELVRYEDLATVQTAFTDLQDVHRRMRDEYGQAADEQRDKLNQAAAASDALQATLEKIRRHVCDLVPGPAPIAPEKVEELARGMVAQLQKAIAPQ